MTGEGNGCVAATGRRFASSFPGGTKRSACRFERSAVTASARRSASPRARFGSADFSTNSGPICASSDDAASAAAVAVATAARDNALRARRFIVGNPEAEAQPPAADRSDSACKYTDAPRVLQ